MGQEGRAPGLHRTAPRAGDFDLALVGRRLRSCQSVGAVGAEAGEGFP